LIKNRRLIREAWPDGSAFAHRVEGCARNDIYLAEVINSKFSRLFFLKKKMAKNSFEQKIWRFIAKS